MKVQAVRKNVIRVRWLCDTEADRCNEICERLSAKGFIRQCREYFSDKKHGVFIYTKDIRLNREETLKLLTGYKQPI